MEKVKSNLTSTIIGVILSLLTIVGFAGSFISNQAKLDVRLTSIEERLVEINSKLDKRDDEIKNLTQRVTVIETEINQ